MAFPVNDRRRIGQSGYWAMLGVNILAIVALLVGGLVLLFSGAYVVGILVLLAIAPVGIYFRVIMMRRCRDIGWPAFLPWAFFGAAFLFNFGLFGGGAGSSPGALALPLLIGLADFVFMIVIGCIGSKEAGGAYYEEVFGSGHAAPVRTGPASAGPAASAVPSYRDADPDGGDEQARWDAAIARALQGQNAAADPARQRPRPVARPQGPRPAAPVFGRRAV